MKKITSFLMMVLFSVVTFAQAVNPITSLDQLKNDAVYTIKSSRCFLLYTSEMPNMLCTSTGSAVPASAKEYNPADPNQQFRIEQHDGKYYLFSVGANKYVNQDGNFGAFNDAAVLTIREQNPGAEYAWYMQLNDYGMNTQISGQSTTGIFVNSWTTADAGNIFEIADIDVSNIDPYEAPYNALSAKYDAITEAIDIEELKAGVNVGTYYGNYKQDITDYFLAKNETVESVIVTYNNGGGLASVKETFATVDELNALTDSYQQAYDSLRTNTIARAMKEIAAGYYTINSAVTFVKPHTTYTYWTEEEAQEWNDAEGLEPGMEGFAVAGELKDSTTTQVQSLKAIYDQNGKASWKEIENKADFLFWIEPTNNDSVPTYKVISKFNNLTFKPIRQSTHAELEACDTAQFIIDYYGVKTLADGTTTPKVAIRNVVTANAEGVKTGISSENGYTYMHAGGHSYNTEEQVGKGLAGTVVGWTHTDCSYWYLAPVDEATALAWIDAANPVKEIRAMVDLADSIAAAFPAQLLIAKDEYTEVYESDSVVVTPDQFYSNAVIIDGTNGLSSAPASAEDTYALLLDGNHGTFFHTAWQNGTVAAHTHYLQIEAADALEGQYAVKMSRRNGAQNDHPTKMAVVGYTENNPDLGYEDGDSITSLNFPFGSATETVVSNLFDGKGYKVFRFYWEDSNGSTDRGYWHASEFNVFRGEEKTHAATTQYTVRKAEADALEAAVATWNEGNYNRDNIELLNDDTFKAAYNAIVAAGAAWGEVYVDPTALRTAIATLPENVEAMYPIGTNPGQWSSRDGITVATVGTAANAYDQSGAYTPAESEAHIEAINNSLAAAIAAANQVQTGVWYRFTFPGQDLYETFGWDKTGAAEAYSTGSNSQTKIEVYRNLWNKVLASGVSTSIYEHEIEVEGETVVDTARQYLPVIEAESFRENQGIFFFTEEELEGKEDISLFRFIQATDSSYMIQHKASGLFLQAGYACVLSPIPSYFHSKAMGAGANLIAWTDVLGNASTGGNNPGYKYKYLHAQRADGALTTWNSENLGSNSMINIEAVSEVTADEIAAIPSTYTKWMWPGYIYNYTYPVDIKIVAADENFGEVVAYGADLNVTETDTTLVLRPVAEGVTIKAGMPFFLVTNPELIGSEKYESTTDAQNRIIEEFEQTEGRDYVTVSEDANYLNSELEAMYAWVTMEHGMTVGTTLHENGKSLRGTLEPTAAKAGKIMTASENGFSLLASDATVHPNRAYIACDFEKGTDISGIAINLNGAPIETGINEVLNKVAQGGNIYTVGGQLVGKGNINTVNNLPAGIYIVNGVKVTKR